MSLAEGLPLFRSHLAGGQGVVRQLSGALGRIRGDGSRGGALGGRASHHDGVEGDAEGSPQAGAEDGLQAGELHEQVGEDREDFGRGEDGQGLQGTAVVLDDLRVLLQLLR